MVTQTRLAPRVRLLELHRARVGAGRAVILDHATKEAIEGPAD